MGWRDAANGGCENGLTVPLQTTLDCGHSRDGALIRTTAGIREKVLVMSSSSSPSQRMLLSRGRVLRVRMPIVC